MKPLPVDDLFWNSTCTSDRAVIIIETQLAIYVAKTYQLEQRERESEREISIQQLLCTDCAHLYSWLSIQVEEIMSIVIVLSVLLPIGASRERTDEEGSR